MKNMLLILFLLLPSQILAGQFPESLELWKERASFFWALDFDDEAKFKKKLVDYYKRIYSGEILITLKKWINDGNLESEYYSSYFNEYRDTKLKSIAETTSKRYTAKTEQSSCFNLDYNPPRMSSIVKKYKVTNYSQSQIDDWMSSLGLAPQAEVCMRIERTINFMLDNDNYVVSEKWNIDRSFVELMSGRS